VAENGRGSGRCDAALAAGDRVSLRDRQAQIHGARELPPVWLGDDPAGAPRQTFDIRTKDPGGSGQGFDEEQARPAIRSGAQYASPRPGSEHVARASAT
jgi:hypothetical protein